MAIMTAVARGFNLPASVPDTAMNALGFMTGENAFGSYIGLREALLGDLDGDNVVATSDFTVLSENYNSIAATWADGDFDGDGDVDVVDFLLQRRQPRHRIRARPEVGRAYRLPQD